MSEPNGYLLHGTAFSSKEAAFEILVHNHEHELRFHKLWDEDAKPYYFEPQPQLTIPKSIADELDEIPNEAKEYVRVNDFGEYSVLDDFVELREFYEADEDDIFPKFMELKDFVKDNLNLCAFYLAGKALGVDLVKVVEE
ncbi:hypothetical protein [Lactococcus lactis]|uniref:hypothetical protein n=1 Tax=Lactococcus lactis TaxID=1358 RepID=UPI00223B8E2A|nr:hypothetical protein [Lactococcus lactis]MCT1181578.1 hypothetical protein [Lactococcus lactis]